MWIWVIRLRSHTAQWIYGFITLVLALVAGRIIVQTGLARSVMAPPAAVYRVETTQPAVALTINVVWGTEYVPQLLTILLEHHALATFMVGGAWAQKHPEWLRQMRQDGMEIGNHGYAHRHVALLSLEQNRTEIDRTNAVVESITGSRPSLFAPPYGEVNATVREAAAQSRMACIMWTLDTIDWRPSSSPSQIVNRILPRVKPGAIILMHPTDRTVQALPSLLRGLSRAHLKPVTVSELLHMGTPRGE